MGHSRPNRRRAQYSAQSTLLEAWSNVKETHHCGVSTGDAEEKWWNKLSANKIRYEIVHIEGTFQTPIHRRGILVLQDFESKAMDDAYTIQISGNLVKQLADNNTNTNKVKKKTRKPKPKTPTPPQQLPIPPPPPPPTTATWPPMYLPIPPPQQPEVNAIRSVLEDSERVLEKLKKQEDVMAVEVTQKAKELHEKEFKLPEAKPMPCLTDLTACLDCYKENVKDPLKCSTLVKSFADCARTIRQKVSESK